MDKNLAYAAGFIDADGSIIIRKYRDPQAVRGVRFSPNIQVKSIDPSILHWMKEMFGGSIILVDTGPRKKNLNANFPLGQWAVSSREAYNLAARIEPFLLIKQKQAQGVLEFYDGAIWTQDGGRIPDSEFERRESIWRKVSSSNQRDYLKRLPIPILAVDTAGKNISDSPHPV